MIFPLPNLSNTCYLNTAIQCLLSSKIFIYFILHNEFPNNTLLNSFKKIVNNINPNNSTGHFIHFAAFVKHLNTVFQKNMNIYEQNDVSELLMILLDKMNSEIGQEFKLDATLIDNNLKSAFCRLDERCMKAYEKQFKDAHSEIIPLFYSFLICQIVCGCNKIHHNYEHFNMLQLEIPTNQQSITLNDCLDLFMKSYTLNIDDQIDKWKCDHCNLCVPSTKSFVFWTLPDILIISFKRFIFDERIHNFRKINVAIDLPKVIDMNKWMLSQKVPVNYELKSIGCHIGSLNYGHYYSMVWSKSEKQWIDIDDTNIRPARFERNLQNAYICVYEKMK